MNHNSNTIPAHLIEPAEPARTPAGPAPRRRAYSVRRTSSLDVVWPANDFESPMHFMGRARDMYTAGSRDQYQILAEDSLSAQISRDRVIEQITTQPERDYVDALVGVRGGGRLREALNTALPQRSDTETPLYLLIDDLAGSSLVAVWAWTQWVDMWSKNFGRDLKAESGTRPSMEGICIGYRPGASSLNVDGTPKITQNATVVPPLRNPDDPDGWHALPEPGGVHFRRARRIDVWREQGRILIDSSFQDSARCPDGRRRAIHEYTVRASADPHTFELLDIDAIAQTLPYTSCLAAPGNTHKLLGTPLNTLRHKVLEQLSRAEGCTHLNDALRALAEVPILIAALDQRTTLTDSPHD